MRAAVRERTSSRSSEAFTPSPISASVVSTSADTSPLGGTTLVTAAVSAGSIPSSIITAPSRIRICEWRASVSMMTAGKSQNFDFRNVPITLGIVEAESDHEFVRYDKTNVVSVDIGKSAFHLVQENCHAKILRFALLQNAEQIAQREPGIQDIFDDDHCLAFDAGVE